MAPEGAYAREDNLLLEYRSRQALAAPRCEPNEWREPEFERISRAILLRSHSVPTRYDLDGPFPGERAHFPLFALRVALFLRHFPADAGGRSDHPPRFREDRPTSPRGPAGNNRTLSKQPIRAVPTTPMGQ